jgi:catechol 2,3-dioxygenase
MAALIAPQRSQSKEKPMTVPFQSNAAVQTPCGLNHLVLNVRDLDESHRFWTEFLGFRQVGTVRDRGGEPRPRMHFYSGEQDGKLRHHDIALVEQPTLPTNSAEGPRAALNHVAIAYPTREAWDKQISSLAAHGVRLYGRVDRGVTNSIHLTDPNGVEVELVYELPREAWQDDIDAALNHFVERPIGE